MKAILNLSTSKADTQEFCMQEVTQAGGDTGRKRRWEDEKTMRRDSYPCNLKPTCYMI